MPAICCPSQQFLAKQRFSVKWRLLSLCNICVRSRIVDWPINCPQVISALVLLLRGHLCREHWLAICQGYYELCLLLVLFFRFLRETSKKHSHRPFFLFSHKSYVLFCSFIWNWFGLKNARVFFQMFSIQYFILDSKTLRFPCCRSFFGAQNRLKKSQAKSGRFISSAPLCWFTRLTFGKHWQRATTPCQLK